MSASTDPVLVEVDAGVAVVTLNRPRVLNAFSRAMGEGLVAALRRLDADDEVRVVVITGAGRAFCAGADLSGGGGTFTGADGSGFRSDPLHRFHPWDVRKPVIAAVNGHAIGLGLTLTFQCDLRLMAADARYGVVQVRRGVLPDLHAHWTLPRLVGWSRAAEILLTGRHFDGRDAERWGLAVAAPPAAEVLPRALALAGEIARETAPVSVGAAKRLLWADRPGRHEIDRLETALHRHLFGLADAREGVVAHLEDRPPRWTGSVVHDWPHGLLPDRPEDPA
ncbi:MAG: crotonase [Actinomyces sp.]|nr:MAG: crotonase [Actinomyces sp.]